MQPRGMTVAVSFRMTSSADSVEEVETGRGEAFPTAGEATDSAERVAIQILENLVFT